VEAASSRFTVNRGVENIELKMTGSTGWNSTQMTLMIMIELKMTGSTGSTGFSPTNGHK
jgi:hypothetical protein